MSSGGALPPQISTVSPFAAFSYLFPSPHTPQGTPPTAFNFHTAQQLQQQQQQQQRFKLKRQRQRVDAGEPRNSYQGAKSGVNSETMTSLFPWMNQSDVDYVKEEQPTDLSVREERNDANAPPTVDDEADSQLDVENTDEIDVSAEVKESETPPPVNDSPVSNESSSSSCSISSSSKRKQCAPQRNLADTLGFEIVAQEAPEEIQVTSGSRENTSPSLESERDQMAREAAVVRDAEETTPLEKLSALQSQLNTPSLNDMMEAQRRLCSNLFEQQKKYMQPEPEKPRVSRDFVQMAQVLKNEINENLCTMIDKIVKEWSSDIARIAAETASSARAQAPPMHAMFPQFQQNPMAFMPPGVHNGIFPPAFNGFNPLAALNSLRRPYMGDDEGCKKKRAKVTDSVRKMAGTPQERESPSSARSSPQLNLSHSTPLSYFPPTMVGHPLYGGVSFGDREDSPTNSDDNSDFGPCDPNQSSTLTPMHLRKAKLMFFYTRYPNSALLKSYFPDIRFNKNNTAQLVKWFSNFREFYYIQMEKYARQALAEGVRGREDIHVTMESEIFKTLNQHYNRNNHIQPPERLVGVVQESLREFYDAIRVGKDAEPSWKKTIYKVINRMDDVIPEYFKEPNFLERLES